MTYRQSLLLQPTDTWKEDFPEIDEDILGTLALLPEEIDGDGAVEVPMTLVVQGPISRKDLGHLLDELSSGDCGLGLGGWGRLYPRFDGQLARTIE